MNHRILNAYANINRELAWEFFTVFSRFEYALKRSPGYLLNQSGRAEPNWDKFASEHESAFSMICRSEILNAKKEIESNPPKKQIVSNGQLIWEESEKRLNCSLVDLLRLVRLVRNNLFHGGKYPSGPQKESIRDDSLLRNSLTILYACIGIEDKISSNFYESIEE